MAWFNDGDPMDIIVPEVTDPIVEGGTIVASEPGSYLVGVANAVEGVTYTLTIPATVTETARLHWTISGLYEGEPFTMDDGAGVDGFQRSYDEASGEGVCIREWTAPFDVEATFHILIGDESTGDVTITAPTVEPRTGRDILDIESESGARLAIDGEGIRAFDSTGTETVSISGEGGEFVGGSFRTSDALPGQVELADDACVTQFYSGAPFPGVRVTPIDTSTMDLPASIGPGDLGLTIYGGRDTTGRSSIVQANPDGSFLRAYYESGAQGGNVQATPNAAHMRTYREDGLKAGEIHTSHDSSSMRTYREDGVKAGEMYTSQDSSVLRNFNGDSLESGWVRVRSQDAELAYVASNNTYFSRIRADGSEAFLYTRAGGANRYLSVDADGVWVKTNKSGSWENYNLEETAQDSGWQSFPVRSGIAATSVAYRNKGGVAFFRGSISSTWAAGWNLVVSGLSEVQPSFEVRTVAPVGSTDNYLVRMTDAGTMEVYAPDAGDKPINLSSLSYPIG